MVDASFLSETQRRIENVASCAALQDAALSLSGIADVQAAIAARLAELQPVLALLHAPDANLAKIVTWITDYIEAVLKPYVRPIEVYAADMVRLASDAAVLAAAIEDRAAQIGDCSVNVRGMLP